MDSSRKLGRLMKVISGAYDATKNALLEQYDLTSRQVDLLGFLREREGREATQKKRLTEKGFVERVTCEDDRRSNVIRLTDEATSVVDECVREFRSMDELVMAGFTDEDEELLMDLLERLLANAEAIRRSQAN